MNVLQDPSKKGSITSLLNPQEVSRYPGHVPTASLPANHGPGQALGGYYPPPYQHTPSTFHLRAANWETSSVSYASSDDQAGKTSPQASRYHAHPDTQSQKPPQPTSNSYTYPQSSQMTKDPPRSSYEPAWQQRPDHRNGSSHSVPATMYPDGRTAASGDHQKSNTYSSIYDDQREQNPNTQMYQVNERASVRLAARSSSGHPPPSADHQRYPQTIYYQRPDNWEPPVHQFLRPQEISVSSAEPSHTKSSQDKRSDPSLPSASNKRPLADSEATAPPNAKRAKGKSKATSKDTPPSSASTGPSRSGYTARMRTSIVISSQDDNHPPVEYEVSSEEIPIHEHPEGTKFKAELQYARCMSNRYKHEVFPRCVSCTRRWAGDTCRFQGIRYFMRDPDNFLVGVSFDQPKSVVHGARMEFPVKWNRRLDREPIRRSKLSIAKALLPTLRAEQEHMKNEEIIRRPRESDVRVTCDTCMTSLFSTSFMCRECGREVCHECFQQVRELTEEPENASPVAMAALVGRREKHAHANPFFLSCLKRQEHSAHQFTAVTRFIRSELNKAIKEMEGILGGIPVSSPTPVAVPEPVEDEEEYLRNLARTGPSPIVSDSRVQPTTIATPSGSVYDVNSFPDPLAAPVYDDYTPVNVGAHITEIPIDRLQIIPAALYDHPPGRSRSRSVPVGEGRVFSALWQKGLPLLVKDVLPRFKMKWTPEYFMDKYGDQNCLVVECQTDDNKRTTISGFFEMFGKYEDRQDCWKLKDWPPTAEFKKVFPELYEDFSEAVPVPDYVRRDGVYNIGSHFPLNAVGPDLGPKMYNALASSQEVGSKGSTRLHMDMADALNVMLYSTPCEDGTEGYAVWDIYRAEDSDIIRAFLKKKFGFSVGAPVVHGYATRRSAASASSSTSAASSSASTNGNSSHSESSKGSNFRPIASAAEKPASKTPVHLAGHDPIHGQQFYLDVALRKELWEDCGVRSYRVYQRPGDGVFIPAGCAHQVANMSDCIKIAIDFVSPENIDRCEKLTKEFREQNQSKVWKEDVLQLRTMMWFAWQSCSMKEESLNREDAAKEEAAAAGHYRSVSPRRMQSVGA